MGTTTIKHTYQCLDDCQPQGCPSHEATLEYQSTAESLHFKDGKGQEIYMQTPELNAFLSMLQLLGGGRTEIEHLIKAAFPKEGEEQAAEAKYKASLPPGINIR